MAKSYQVFGTVRYDVDMIIQAEDEEDAIRYFEEFAAVDQVCHGGALEDVEVDDVNELRDLDEEPDYITVNGADDEDEEDDL